MNVDTTYSPPAADIDRAQIARAHRWRCRPRRVWHRTARRSRPLLPRLAHCLHVVSRDRPWVDGADHDPAPVGRRRGECSAGSSRHRAARSHCSPCCSSRCCLAWGRCIHGRMPIMSPADEVLRHKSVYLNTTFFFVRAVVYFAGWLGIAFLLNKWSRLQDSGRRGREHTAAAPVGSGPGLLRARRDLCRHRLDHVAQPALVLDDLRVPDDGRAGARGAWRLRSSSRRSCSSTSRCPVCSSRITSTTSAS